MNAANLRLVLAREIMSTNDESILMRVSEILQPDNSQVQCFSSELRQRIDRGLEQMRLNELVDDEQVQRELDAWLEK